MAPVRSLLQPQVKGLGDLEPVALGKGDTVDLDDVVRRLADAAYSRVDLVERRGEFAVRGGIVDIFPPTEEHPLRVEFWGDDVEEIRSFAVADQRTLETVERLWAPPCRELLLTDEVRRRAAELGEAHPQLVELTDKIAAGIAVEGMESLAPVLVDEMEMLTDADARRHPRARRSTPSALAAGRTTWSPPARSSSARPGRQRPAAGSLRSTWAPRPTASSATSASTTLGQGQGVVDAQPVRHCDDRRPTRSTVDGRAVDSARRVPGGPRAAESYRGDIERAVVDIQRWLVRRLAGRRPPPRTRPGPADGRGARRARRPGAAGRGRAGRPLDAGTGSSRSPAGGLQHGLVHEGLRLAILTGDDLSGQKASTRDMRRMPARRKKQIDPLELKAGDYVVHEQHGVGRFVEMRQREVQGATREYLVLEYGASKRGGPADRLYVPADALDQVTRYVGGEQPSLDRLGGADWSKRKNRARKAVREIAAELIKLYAARQATQGFAFGPDTPWQRELEDAFPFHETPDQLTTVDEVKADMRRTVPMDRLVCGDVGYGKTEIAVRAAFKAIQDGKQVAVLVPTTLLVTQHFSTFAERMSGFPVVLKSLSPVPDRQGGARGDRGPAPTARSTS